VGTRRAGRARRPRIDVVMGGELPHRAVATMKFEAERAMAVPGSPQPAANTRRIAPYAVHAERAALITAEEIADATNATGACSGTLASPKSRDSRL